MNILKPSREFPDSPVVRTLGLHCWGSGFNPWSGKLGSHRLYGIAKKPHKNPKETKKHATTELTLKSNEFMLCELYFNERNACQVKKCHWLWGHPDFPDIKMWKRQNIGEKAWVFYDCRVHLGFPFCHSHGHRSAAHMCGLRSTFHPYPLCSLGLGC